MSLIQEEPTAASGWHTSRWSAAAGQRCCRAAFTALRDKVLADFSWMQPEKFTNVTNGITPRRFLRVANPGLSALITGGHRTRLGDRSGALRGLEPWLTTHPSGNSSQPSRPRTKRGFSNLLAERDDLILDPTSMFDVMVKRLHEYKRQILKLLHVVTLYQRIKSNLDVSHRAPHHHLRRKSRPGLCDGQTDDRA